MSKVKIQGNASGTGVITLTAPNTSTDRTVTLPDEDITLGGGVDGIVSTADATAITINSSEQVGIGKTPVNTLDVNHSGGAVVKLWRDSNSGYLQFDTDGTNSHIKNGGGPIKFKTGSDTVRASVTDNGICFGTDTAAANALDDYEEGTWTPAFTFDSGTFSGSYTAQHGHYTKVGRIVTASFYFNTSSVNLSGIDAGTALKIGGLPFASSSNSGMTATTSSFRTQNWNSNAHSPIIGYQNANTSEIRLARYNGSTDYNTDYKSVSADLRTASDSNQLMGTITYQAS